MGQGGQDGQAAQGRRRRTIEAVPGVRQELGRRDLGGKARQGKVFNKGEVVGTSPRHSSADTDGCIFLLMCYFKVWQCQRVPWAKSLSA